MSAVMVGTMVLCFMLTISVAVSIGLAAILGIYVSNVNMLPSLQALRSATVYSGDSLGERR